MTAAPEQRLVRKPVCGFDFHARAKAVHRGDGRASPKPVAASVNELARRRSATRSRVSSRLNQTPIQSWMDPRLLFLNVLVAKPQIVGMCCSTVHQYRPLDKPVRRELRTVDAIFRRVDDRECARVTRDQPWRQSGQCSLLLLKRCRGTRRPSWSSAPTGAWSNGRERAHGQVALRGRS